MTDDGYPFWVRNIGLAWLVPGVGFGALASWLADRAELSHNWSTLCLFAGIIFGWCVAVGAMNLWFRRRKRRRLAAVLERRPS